MASSTAPTIITNPARVDLKPQNDPGAFLSAMIPATLETTFNGGQIERIRSAAARCSIAGYRRIALFGGGRHTARIVRQPWTDVDVQVVAIIDDAPKANAIRGVPVFTPDRFNLPVDAIVVSSDMYEELLLARAKAVFADLAPKLPILSIYGETPDARAALKARLVQHWNISPTDAEWLIENKAERHDATLPILPVERTELHLRRYELAAMLAQGKRCLDAACGTGYGSRMLLNHGATAYLGIDIDQRAVDYAKRRFAHPSARFECRSATDTGVPSASIDLVTSFETIEHIPDLDTFVNEMARVLVPGGALCLSTPNDGGLTDFHVHSFTRQSLESLLAKRFTNIRTFAQRATNIPILSGSGAGVTPCRDDVFTLAESWFVVAQKPQ